MLAFQPTSSVFLKPTFVSTFLSASPLALISFLQLSGLEPVLTTSSPSAAGRHKNIVTVSYLHSKCNFFPPMCCTAVLQLPHSRTYSMAQEMCKATRCDSPSELPGFHLGTSWTVRIAMLMYREEKKKLVNVYSMKPRGRKVPSSIIELGTPTW
jgi:hypothetical protein